ncbi:nucleotidyltransferase [Bacillus subtilis]|uniref:nucleotidyltransferase n=1 Tax=Bacillus subtilis TaxID=1423 RepID=UPI0003A0DE2B|nr:nucleotidyltransferase [Bacillus subtilis]
MKAVGLVVEFNPFHNGHAYYVQEAKKQTKSDLAIAVMSGNFLQRGEPALVSKWSRTRMALQNGVDIVIELPYMYAVQRADIFAHGAVNILNHIGCSTLYFSSEDGKIERFYHELELYQKEEKAIYNVFKKEIKSGKNFAAAMAKSFETYQDKKGVNLALPNNILGFHYVKTIKDLNLPIKPMTGPRLHQGYHELVLPKNKKSFASATSIRNALFETGDIDKIKKFIPDNIAFELKLYKEKYGMWHSHEDYFSFLKYNLSLLSEKELSQIYEVEEGLENRILKLYLSAPSFQEYMTKLKTKRYTWTKLQRLNVHLLTHAKNKELSQLLHEGIPYIRILGMTTKGQSFLSNKKKDLKFPLISNPSKYSHTALNLDIKASLVYSAPLTEPARSEFYKQEFSPIRYNEINKAFL